MEKQSVLINQRTRNVEPNQKEPEKDQSMPTYQKSLERILAELGSSPQGLADAQVKDKREQFGFNELAAQEKESLFMLFLNTFKDAMVIVLLLVASIQLVMGHAMESLIIFAVLMINAVISVLQTRKAESSLDALKELSAPEAKVIRNGVKTAVPARELVPGDIVMLEAGDHVPADGRLLEEGSMKVDEGMLTGESVPVEKDVLDIVGSVPLGDRVNMVHSGSLVVYGRGLYVVTETANQTEIGQVANLLNEAETQTTPLQRNLDHFSKRLGVGILLLSLVILGIQVARIFLSDSPNVGAALLNAFMFAVAVAVAAIPEALQSIVTIVLSIGTKTMAKKNAIIRKLPAVETLGSTSIIATDKTGTLTQNKMTVVDFYLANGTTDTFNEAPNTWTIDEQRFVQAAVLANDATITADGQRLGDPTEIALVAFSDKVNQPTEALREAYPRLAELPFDSDRKLMSTLHQINGQNVMLTKGGPDVLFKRSTHILVNGEVLPLTEAELHRLQEQNESFSKRALRVLALAYKPLQNQEFSLDEEQGLIIIGLIAMKAMSGGLITHAATTFAFLRQFDNVLPIWGVQRPRELEEFLTFEKKPPILDEALQAMIDQDRCQLAGAFCRGCGYCQPCPAKIPIETAARISLLLTRAPYQGFMTDAFYGEMQRIKDCTHCNHCKNHCPYGLDTPQLLQSMREEYNKFYDAHKA